METKDREIINNIINGDNTFRYQMLDRLKCDVNYYLGYGNRNPKVLWFGDEKLQIQLMLELYDSFETKPEWLTKVEILAKAKEMGVDVEQLEYKINMELKDLKRIYLKTESQLEQAKSLMMSEVHRVTVLMIKYKGSVDLDEYVLKIEDSSVVCYSVEEPNEGMVYTDEMLFNLYLGNSDFAYLVDEFIEFQSK